MFKLLRVNLTNQEVTERIVSSKDVERYLGGRGLGAKILYEELEAHTDPLSANNKILFLTSPLIGTKAPSCVKLSVVTKSPLTNTILVSLMGGHFAPELRFTGYDGLIVEGKASVPVYLWISNGKAEIRNASYLWGLSTVETQLRLQQELQNNHIQVACIGPASEAGVKFGSIVSGRHAAGRGGAGTVVASKNLKAIAVKGSLKVPVARPDQFRAAVDIVKDNFRRSEKLKIFGKYGTSRVVDPVNERGILPTENFQKGVFNQADKINGNALQQFVKKKLTCFGCPVACTHYAVVEEGPYKGAVTEGPEYETLVTLGSLCGNSCLEAIIAADELCDKYGIDSISTGNAIAFAMECFERGILTEEDTDGLELKFGNDAAMVAMVKQIGERKGLGKILGEGIKFAAQEIGKNAGEYAMHIKGMELPGYDPRGAKATGLGFVTSPRGGCHERGLVTRETFGALPPIDRFSISGKGEVLKETQDEMTVLDSLGICVFPAHNGGINMDDIASLFSSAIGVQVDEHVLMTAGERIWNIERLFNIREGFDRKDDTIPKRFLEESFQEGPSKGHLFELDALLEDYYLARGWDERGKPRAETLKRLGLQENETK